MLFDVGDQNTPFFVVVSGTVDIVRLIGDREEPITVYHPGEFSGEINMLSARRSSVRGRVTSDGEVIVVDRAALRTLIQRDAELSEILMRAFILRRVALVSEDDNDLVLLGSRHSGSTQSIREFLSRNGQPFTYQDVETDPSVQELFDRFHIGVNDVPVIVCQGGHILKNPTIESLAPRLGLSAELDPKEARDVVIVGARAGGARRVVYGASEGLDVLVLESTAPGGQAGTSRPTRLSNRSTSRLVGHSQVRGHAQRPRVRGVDERRGPPLPALLEDVTEDLGGGLARDPLAPERAERVPSELDLGPSLAEEGTHVADEYARAPLLDRPPARARQEPAARVASEDAPRRPAVVDAQERHRLLVCEVRGEGVEVGHPVLSQREPGGLEVWNGDGGGALLQHRW